MAESMSGPTAWQTPRLVLLTSLADAEAKDVQLVEAALLGPS